MTSDDRYSCKQQFSINQSIYELLNKTHSVPISGLKVIKLEYILRLKIKRIDWLIADTCPQAANHYALFESENELKFYNLEARIDL